MSNPEIKFVNPNSLGMQSIIAGLRRNQAACEAAIDLMPIQVVSLREQVAEEENCDVQFIDEDGNGIELIKTK